MSKVNCYVYKGHTLGFISNGWFSALNGLGTLGGMPISDGPHLVTEITEGDYRPATLKDFETFRVKHHPDYLVIT